MKVIILGAGVIGTTTAHYLATQGAEVTVIDRQAGPALETSYANAGQVSPGYSTPWAAPGIPFKALKWMFDPHAPLALRPDGSLYQLRWMWQMLRNCSPERYAVNKERMMRVAEYSRDCLMTLRADLKLPYEHRTGGTLQLFRTDEQMDAAQRDMTVLRECGVPFQLLDASGVVHHEPGLAHAAGRLTGGLRLPNDETGDCHMFTRGLAEVNERLGVKTIYGKSVQRILVSSGAGRQIQGVVIDGRPLTADRYVLAFGSYSRQTARDIGLDLPVYPVKGYSLTVPLVDEAMAPRSTVLDETYKIAVTRFDQRIRVGGMAELAGFDMRLNPQRRKTLELVTTQLFPGGDLSRAEFWTGLRPMTPDGTPILGPSPIRNLYLNTGHGTLGWTMACGSGRIVADLVMGRRPDINVDGLDLSRYAPAQAHLPQGRVTATGPSHQVQS